MKEIEIVEEKTIFAILDELHLSSVSILVAVNGILINQNPLKDKKLQKGDKVLIIPV
jgi:thiamine biosynthesis protein ThiS